MGTLATRLLIQFKVESSTENSIFPGANFTIESKNITREWTRQNEKAASRGAKL